MHRFFTKFPKISEKIEKNRKNGVPKALGGGFFGFLGGGVKKGGSETPLGTPKNRSAKHAAVRVKIYFMAAYIGWVARF